MSSSFKSFAVGIILICLASLAFLFAFPHFAAAATCASSTEVTGYSTGSSDFDATFNSGSGAASIETSTTTDYTVCSVSIYGRRATYSADFLLEIASDKATNAGRTVFASTTFTNTVFSTSDSWKTISFSSNPLLSANTTYYVNLIYVSGTGIIRWRGDNTSPSYPLAYWVGSTLQTNDILFYISGVPQSSSGSSSTSTTSCVYAIIDPMQPLTGQSCVTSGATTTCTYTTATTTEAIEEETFFSGFDCFTTKCKDGKCNYKTESC